MARNTVAQQFRETATEEQWRQIVIDHDELSDSHFRDKYNFSWSAVMNDAVERGYYEKKKRYHSVIQSQKKADGTDVFFVTSQSAGVKKVARSVQLREDIYSRLQSLEYDNDQYTHISILNQLLDDALRKYGY